VRVEEVSLMERAFSVKEEAVAPVVERLGQVGKVVMPHLS
jgi:hypothetical protein